MRFSAFDKIFIAGIVLNVLAVAYFVKALVLP